MSSLRLFTTGIKLAVLNAKVPSMVFQGSEFGQKFTGAKNRKPMPWENVAEGRSRGEAIVLSGAKGMGKLSGPALERRIRTGHCRRLPNVR